jgi:hypothetical protein
MAKKKSKKKSHDEYDGDEYDELSEREQYAEEYGDDSLEALDDLLSDFPELDEYLDDEFLEIDDEGFYEVGK